MSRVLSLLDLIILHSTLYSHSYGELAPLFGEMEEWDDAFTETVTSIMNGLVELNIDDDNEDNLAGVLTASMNSIIPYRLREGEERL